MNSAEGMAVSLSRAGEVLQAYLLDGTQLSCGSTEIELPQATIALKVAAVEDRTYHLEAPVPEDVVAAGAYILAGDTGYEVSSTDAKIIK